jgi:hypothetical protein
MQDTLTLASKLVAGMSVLFISNRIDPQLHRTLEKTFKVKIDWQVVEKVREIQSVCTRISNHRYGSVWVQTSFISHKTDVLIKASCRGSGTPYVPVNKGRPNAVASSLLDSR